MPHICILNKFLINMLFSLNCSDYQVVKSQLGEIANIKTTQAEKKNYGNVLGGRFFEGIGNASDVISLIRWVIHQNGRYNTFCK